MSIITQNMANKAYETMQFEIRKARAAGDHERADRLREGILNLSGAKQVDTWNVHNRTR